MSTTKTYTPAQKKAIIAKLIPAFTRALPMQMVQNNRKKCFAVIANYTSKKTNETVASILSLDEMGEILTGVENNHITRAMGSVDF